jgi:hypothetical protein
MLPSALLLPAVLWILFSTAAILLVSNQYTAVDGALRCMSVYWHGRPYVGPNNHLLYPASVWLWSQLASKAGVHQSGPVTFLHVVAALNAISAGGSIALVNATARRLTGNASSSLLAAVVFGLSWAMLQHATSSAEPMIGLFFSLIAVFTTIVGLSSGRLLPLFAGGICLALALASYESMVLVAPLLYLLCLTRPLQAGTTIGERESLMPLTTVLFSMLGTVVGIVTIYGTAYYSTGISNPGAMLHAFIRLGGEPQVYGGFGVARIVNLPVGLAANLVKVLPTDYRGVRWLLHREMLTSAALLACFLALVLCALTLLARAAIKECRSPQVIIIAAVCCVGLAFELFPLLYWDPMYNKLWLQPLALLTVLGAVLGTRMSRLGTRTLVVIVLLIILTELSINLPQVVRDHAEPTRCLADASIANELIRPGDKVVTDFDPVSSLWMGLYDREPARTLLFPATPGLTSLSMLNRWIGECGGSSCRIVFIALLDQPADVWESFLGDRLNVHYASLDRFRRWSHRIREFSCEDSSLRIYDPTAIRVQSR